MDTRIIPEYLLPITQRLEIEKGPLKGSRYLTGEKLIPKDWTVYKRERGQIIKDGHLDFSKSGSSDINMQPLPKNNKTWYVAKDNRALQNTFGLQKVQLPKTPPLSPKMTQITRITSPPTSSISSPKNSRGGKKSRTRRRNRRGTRRK